MNKLLEPLAKCESMEELQSAMQSLCASFGDISRLDILPASHLGRRQALCFLRMDTREQEEKIVHELGVGRFGGDLILVVDLVPLEAANAQQMFAGNSTTRWGDEPRRAAM
jgi:hypothetical protein